MLDYSGEVWNVYEYSKLKDYDDWIMAKQFLTEEAAKKEAIEIAKIKGRYVGLLEFSD